MKVATVRGLAIALVGAGVVSLVALSKPSSVTVQRSQGRSGLAIEGPVIKIDDWGRWMKWAPVAIEDAIAKGNTDADDIAVVVFRQALPGHVFPPGVGDPGRAQWSELVQVIARMLHLQPTEPPGLRVVR